MADAKLSGRDVIFFLSALSQQKGKRNANFSVLSASNDPERRRRGVGGEYTKMAKDKPRYPHTRVVGG
jgi:hypothetical protein